MTFVVKVSTEGCLVQQWLMTSKLGGQLTEHLEWATKFPSVTWAAEHLTNYCLHARTNVLGASIELLEFSRPNPITPPE